MTASLRFTDVHAGYGRTGIVHGVSLATRPGAVVAILGSNGCGKSTTLRTAMGLTTVTAGRIDLDGRDITRLPAHLRVEAGIGYVPQTENVFGDLSVEDNLRMGCFIRPASFREMKAEALAMFPELAPHLHKEARLLSGGERRMLSIAQTLMPRPRVLLMDEPSSDLSPKLVETVFAKIVTLRDRLGLPILLVEQNVTKALEIADHIHVLAEGRNVLDCPKGGVTLAELGEIFLGRAPHGADTHP